MKFRGGFLGIGRALTLGRIFREGYVALVGLLFFLVGLGYLVDPSGIVRTIHPAWPLDYLMNSLYCLGGGVVLFGFFDRRPGVESAGHTLVAFGLVINVAYATAELGAHINTLLAIVFLSGSILRAIGLAMRWQETLK